MSNEVQVEIKGLSELKDAFEDLANAMTRTEEMGDVLLSAAVALRGEIVQAAPKRTGFLSEHISISKPKQYLDGSVRLRVKPSNSKYPKDENGNPGWVTHGKPQFRDLLFRRAEPLFYAFDILRDEHPISDDEEEQRRFRNGEDLRYVPLIDRKLRLHPVVPKRVERLHYCDHIDGDGEGLFRLSCEHDLEGIVAKRKSDPYLREYTNWLKIRNKNYCQWIGREELVERERGSDPDFQVWDGCALACESAEM